MTLALLTDFGLKDPFVAMMKAVILSRVRIPVQFLDLTHEVAPQDVRAGAFYLRAAAPYLPQGTLVLAVVDPEVGSQRSIIWARTKKLSFLAPDNGLLSWLDEEFEEIRHVRSERFALPELSGTFHGRDVFAPAAAALLSGTRPSALGPRLKEYKRLAALRPRVQKNAIVGEIVAADRFGNCWTSLRSRELKPEGSFEYKKAKLGRLKRRYSEAGEGKPLAVAGSFGFVELAVRNGNFNRRYKARPGDEVIYHG